MEPDADPVALGELLRSRRARLTPDEVGLPAGNRRRTPGLRREEVALLANLSTTYYTFLEQGRPVRPSGQVLDALATALRLTGVERRYLEVLAYGAPRREAAVPVTAGPAVWTEWLAPDVVDLVERLEPHPTYVKGRRWDVLASNPAARELFTDWEARPAYDRNLVRWMFTSAEAPQIYLDWESEARAMLGRFRMAAARFRDEPAFAALIEDLRATSEHVRRWWPDHDVAAVGSGVKKLRHPRFGPLEYRHVVLQIADNPDQTLVTFTASST